MIKTDNWPQPKEDDLKDEELLSAIIRIKKMLQGRVDKARWWSNLFPKSVSRSLEYKKATVDLLALIKTLELCGRLANNVNFLVDGVEFLSEELMKSNDLDLETSPKPPKKTSLN